jgi:hypothetical protein
MYANIFNEIDHGLTSVSLQTIYFVPHFNDLLAVQHLTGWSHAGVLLQHRILRYSVWQPMVMISGDRLMPSVNETESFRKRFVSMVAEWTSCLSEPGLW